MKKQEYEAKRKLSTDTLEPVIITKKPEPKTPTPNQQLETSFICEDDTEFWENMTQMQVNYIFFLNDQKLILLKLFFWTEELLSFLFMWVGKTTYFISIGTFHLNRLSVFFEDTFEQELLCRD